MKFRQSSKTWVYLHFWKKNWEIDAKIKTPGPSRPPGSFSSIRARLVTPQPLNVTLSFAPTLAEPKIVLCEMKTKVNLNLNLNLNLKCWGVTTGFILPIGLSVPLPLTCKQSLEVISLQNIFEIIPFENHGIASTPPPPLNFESLPYT